MGEPVLFWGATGQAIVLHEFLCARDYSLTALVDRDPAVESPFPGVPLYRDLESLQEGLEKAGIHLPGFVVAIGGARGADRAAVSETLRGRGFRPVQAIHPMAWIAEDAGLGAGLQALAGSRVGARAQVGDWVILNTGASVDHECRLGPGAHLAPGVTLCGCVEVGACTLVGAGSVVLPRVRIGSHSIIGAGSVVTRDIPDGVVAYGSPARVVRSVEKKP